jgi:hypothetical protein
MPHHKVTYPIAALNKLAAHILHGVLTEVTYEEVTEVFGNCYNDHHLKASFHSQLNRRTQLVRESMQEFAGSTDHLVHSTHVELPKHLIGKEATHAFADGIREEDIRWQLLLGTRRHSARPSV